MKKVLIIDDETEFADMLRMRLEANSYEVFTADNGADGIVAAGVEKPDVILLDIMMPVMDGYETLRRLRRSEEMIKIPVIMLTAKGESRSIFKAQELGVTDYLIKPCESQTLLALLAKHA